MSSLINPQLQSKFFTLPTEIRYAIYAHLIPETIHLSLDERGLRLSPCVQRDGDGDPECWKRRSNHELLHKHPDADPIYLNRLRSTWGEHWRCEEATVPVQEGTDSDNHVNRLSFVCKRMYDTHEAACNKCLY
jgi:hypothetical protein